MERELTPVEARSGVVSGRILTILVVSSRRRRRGAGALLGYSSSRR